MKNIAIALFTSLLLALAGCSGGDETPAPSSTAPAPAATTSAPPPAPQGNYTQGKVTQAMQAGMYTYIEADVNGKNVWLAASKVEVSVGDTVRWGDAALMKDFPSKTLKRTFDEILFVSKVDVIK
ncbi:MAG: hypothetical protein R8K46_00405 [Mariprofundaceae bacterium]